MSVKTIQHAGNLGSAQTGRDWSRGVWHNCPILAIKDGELPGTIFEFDFNTLPKTPPTTEGNFGLFSAFTDTGGFINAGTAGGWVFGSDGDNEGASIRSRATPFKIARTTKRFWFEASVKTSTITDTKHGIFCGMIQDVALTATVPLTAAGALADTNLFGFHRLEGDGDYFDTVYKADGVTAVTVQSDAALLVADTRIKLGMVYEPEFDSTIHDPNYSGVPKYNLKFFANGVPLSSYKQIPSADGTDFPNDVNMGFVFAVLNATASSPGDSTIDRVRIAQLY